MYPDGGLCSGAVGDAISVMAKMDSNDDNEGGGYSSSEGEG